MARYGVVSHYLVHKRAECRGAEPGGDLGFRYEPFALPGSSVLMMTSRSGHIACG